MDKEFEVLVKSSPKEVWVVSGSSQSYSGEQWYIDKTEADWEASVINAEPYGSASVYRDIRYTSVEYTYFDTKEEIKSYISSLEGDVEVFVGRLWGAGNYDLRSIGQLERI